MKKNLNAILYTIIVVVAMMTIGVVHVFSSKSDDDELHAKLVDYQQRLELYRNAVEQTEIQNLDAAEVFENTPAFKELVGQMNENREFQKDFRYDK